MRQMYRVLEKSARNFGAAQQTALVRAWLNNDAGVWRRGKGPGGVGLGHSCALSGSSSKNDSPFKLQFLDPVTRCPDQTTRQATQPADIYECLRKHDFCLRPFRLIIIMTDDNTEPERGKAIGNTWDTWDRISYSKTTIQEAQERLGTTLDSLAHDAIPVEKMLEQCKSLGAVESERNELKRKVYKTIVQLLHVTGYPTKGDPDFGVANTGDLICLILFPIISHFQHKTGRSVRLRRDKEILSEESEMGDREEYLTMALILVDGQELILVIGAKECFVEEAIKQCLLTMKDMRDRNGVGEVYGFVTTGETWQMLSYDGAFRMTRKMDVLFDGMDRDPELWLKNRGEGNTAIVHGEPLEPAG
ncbi:hypothetical protein B9Z19DRAFT_1125034 [Tuber borchii]|uniref:Uncharacterized protein n=1 Tax=Tuber borchii TaxID=42251 RepID=A0A2T6ZVK5_TUBBO|nr:hypothetical protein B9Z19DRAFT_1125034 [Tuber borchii]